MARASISASNSPTPRKNERSVLPRKRTKRKKRAATKMSPTTRKLPKIRTKERHQAKRYLNHLIKVKTKMVKVMTRKKPVRMADATVGHLNLFQRLQMTPMQKRAKL